MKYRLYAPIYMHNNNNLSETWQLN